VQLNAAQNITVLERVMSGGTLGVLNVGAGDIKLSFDNKDAAETIRAKRMVTDMLRRGYAILVAVPNKRKGQPTTYARVLEFDETKCEYIIADYDPVVAAKADEEEHEQDEQGSETAEAPAESAAAGKPKSRGRRTTRVPASSTTGVAVARTAGG
jgi:hypothetical protein